MKRAADQPLTSADKTRMHVDPVGDSPGEPAAGDSPSPPPPPPLPPTAKRGFGTAPPEWDTRWKNINGVWRWTCAGPHDRRELHGVLSTEDCDALIRLWERNRFDLYEGSGKERKERRNFEVRPKMPVADQAEFGAIANKVVEKIGDAFGQPSDLDQATLSSTNDVGHAQHADNELYYVRRLNRPTLVPIPDYSDRPPADCVRWDTHPIEPDAVTVSAGGSPGELTLVVNDEPPLAFRSLGLEGHGGDRLVCGGCASGGDRRLGLPRGPPLRGMLATLRCFAERAGVPPALNIQASEMLEGVACPDAGGGCGGGTEPAGCECSKCGLRCCAECLQVHQCEAVEQLDAVRRGLATVEWRTGPTGHRNFGCSVGLNARDEYEGGGVHFVEKFGDDEPVASYFAGKGDAVAFCGCRRNIHMVKPVTKGQRLVLLLWTRPRGVAPPRGSFSALPRPGTGPGVWLTMGDDGI